MDEQEGLAGRGPFNDEGVVGSGPSDQEGLSGRGPADDEGLVGSGPGDREGVAGIGPGNDDGLVGSGRGYGGPVSGSDTVPRTDSAAPVDNWTDNPAEDRRGPYSLDQSSSVDTSPPDIGPDVYQEQDGIPVTQDPIRGGTLAGAPQSVPPEDQLQGAYGGTGGDEEPSTTPDYPPADDASDVNDIPLNP